MNKKRRKLTGILLVFAALMTLFAGCAPQWQEVAEQLAKEQIAIESVMDEVNEETENAFDEAEKEVQDALDEAGEEVKDALDEAGKEVDDALDEADKEVQDALDEARKEINDKVAEDEYYYDLQNVVLYLETYHHLPDNYITKDEARDLGWEGGSVEDYKKDAAIGGDRFGNHEGILPKAGKNAYHECDIDTHGYKNRGSRRLIYTDDGQYYYSKDHYETFQQVLVGEDGTVSFGETLR